MVAQDCNVVGTISSHNKEVDMSERIYKKIEIVGTSTKGVDDAIRNAIETANKTVSNIGWFEVIETTGRVIEGKITQFQVTMKVGFLLERE